MNIFDGENWPVWAWIAIGVIASSAVISHGMSAGAVAQAEAEVAAKALESGYVQRVVEDSSGFTHEIWVKPDCKCKLLTEVEDE